MADQAAARGTHREAHRDFLLPEGGAGQKKVGDVCAGDQQNGAGHNHQSQERQAVIAAEAAQTVCSRRGIEGVLQILLPVVAAPVWRQSGLKNLWGQGFQPRSDLFCPQSRFGTSDYSKPPGTALVEHAAKGCVKNRFGTDGYRNLELAADVDPIEARLDNANDGERMTIECDGSSDDLAITGITVLPKIVGEDGRGRTTAPIVVRRKCPSENHPDSKGTKEVSADHDAVGGIHFTA